MNELLWFGVGVGLGYCVFFKPKPEIEIQTKVFWRSVPLPSFHMDHVHCTLDTYVQHPPIQFDNPFDKKMRDIADALYTPFIHAKLSLPPVRLETLDWRDR